MNGIVHKCTHEEGSDEDLSETMIFQKIGSYIDHLFNLVEPKKLLYLAVDGVAPQAKMNQQRQRRFKSNVEKTESRKAKIERGESVSDTPFDSNCITPGTEFMQRLSDLLEYYVRSKIASDPKWQAIEVIVSSSQVVGEGEHKIMQYIRQTRMQDDYDANLRHCLYGLDADLIMLALLSHEHHIALLREEVVFGKPQEPRQVMVRPQDFQLLHISLLREYFRLEFSAVQLPFPFDVDRIIDDFVFMGYFVGNDFMPSIPTIGIIGGGLDKIFALYKQLLPSFGDYMTHWGSVNLSLVKRLLAAHAEEETKIFKEMAKEAERLAQMMIENMGIDSLLVTTNKRRNGEDSKRTAKDVLAPETPLEKPADVHDFLRAEGIIVEDETTGDNEVEDDSDLFGKVMDKRPKANHLSEELESDQYIMSESLGKDNYYRKKFPHFYAHTPEAQAWAAEEHRTGEAPRSTQECVADLCYEYVKGLIWCYKYYYAGVASWRWFYKPRHAPMASSLAASSMENYTFEFNYDKPFTPFQQLLSVLPPGSASLVPPIYQPLMLSPESAIIDFYPKHFLMDMDGKRAAWEGIALIPHIDDARFVKAFTAIDEALLTAEEKRRMHNLDTPFVLRYAGNGSKQKQSGSILSKPFVFQDVNQIIFPPLPVAPITSEPFNLPLCPVSPSFLTPKEKKTLERLDAEESKIITFCDEYPTQGRYIPMTLPSANYPLPSFPSLHFVPSLSGQLRHAKLNIFGRKSHQPSFILSSDAFSHHASDDFVSLGRRYPIGSLVYYNYPYISYGLVAAYTDGRKMVYRNVHQQNGRQSEQLLTEDLVGAERSRYEEECQDITQKFQTKKGIEARHVQSLVYVIPIVGMKGFPDGSLERDFESNEWIPCPAQLLFPVTELETPYQASSKSKTKAKGKKGKSQNVDADADESASASATDAETDGETEGETDVDHVNVTKSQRKKHDPRPSQQELKYASTSALSLARTVGRFPNVSVKPDVRFLPKPALNTKQLFPVGGQVISLEKSAKLLGAKGVITSVDFSSPTPSAVVELRVPVPYKKADLKNAITENEPRYYPIYIAAKRLGLSTSMLNSICSSIILSYDRSEIGLTMKSPNFGYCVHDFIKCGDPWADGQSTENYLHLESRPWLVSDLTIALVRKYKSAFPELFTGLEMLPPYKRRDVDLIRVARARGTTVFELTASIQTFLKGLHLGGLIAAPVTSQCLSYSSCTAIELIASEMQERDLRLAAAAKLANKKEIISDHGLKHVITETIPLANLYSPVSPIPWSPSFQLDSTQGISGLVALGDRVVCIRTDHSVPFGLQGVVVAVHAVGRLLEVIFDHTFLSATTLRGKCTEARGYVVSVDCVLNVSMPQNIHSYSREQILLINNAQAGIYNDDTNTATHANAKAQKAHSKASKAKGENVKMSQESATATTEAQPEAESAGPKTGKAGKMAKAGTGKGGRASQPDAVVEDAPKTAKPKAVKAKAPAPAPVATDDKPVKAAKSAKPVRAAKAKGDATTTTTTTTISATPISFGVAQPVKPVDAIKTEELAKNLTALTQQFSSATISAPTASTSNLSAMNAYYSGVNQQTAAPAYNHNFAGYSSAPSGQNAYVPHPHPHQYMHVPHPKNQQKPHQQQTKPPAPPSA